MKRMLALLLICTFSLSLPSGCAPASPAAKELSAPTITDAPADSQAVDLALADFGLELLKRARNTEERTSTLLSPLSGALALSMAANGAGGDTLTQFEAALGGASLDELNGACAQLLADYQNLGGSSECSVANSLWCAPDGQIRQDFIGKCRGNFDAQVMEADLSGPGIVRELNRWVSDRTHKMIPAIINEPFSENTAALLVNALYLKNAWAREFDPLSTGEHEFTHADGQTERIEFLNEYEQTFSCLLGDGVQGVVLPYDDGRLAFAALLPDGNLDGWLDSLDGAALVRLINHGEDALFLRLSLPKFEAEWKGDLAEILAEMGLDSAFDPDRADFSQLGDDPDGYFISQVIHAARIEVNEKGTEAAAATVVDMAAGSAPPPPDGIRLVLDRPFLYGIVDLERGVPLFLGTFE